MSDASAADLSRLDAARSLPGCLRTVLEMINVEHTLFVLPFAFLGMLLAAEGIPRWRAILWITAAMVGARSAAMAFNRLVDRRLDAENPRSPTRAAGGAADAPRLEVVEPGRGISLVGP